LNEFAAIDPQLLTEDELHRAGGPVWAPLKHNASPVLGGSDASFDNSAKESSAPELDPGVLSGSGISNVEELALSTGPDVPHTLLSAPEDFIRTFSCINIVKAWKPLKDVAFLSIGNSRDAPTRFKFPCPNAHFGCTSTSYTSLELDQHAAGCTMTSEEKHQELLADDLLRTHKCTRANCTSKGFKSLGELNSHVKKVHDAVWIPKACECDPTKLYKSKSAWNMHKRSAHGTYIAQRCGFPDCAHDNIFDALDALIGHMKKKHALKRAEAKQYILEKSAAEEDAE
jgi:hypothetical protein